MPVELPIYYDELQNAYAQTIGRGERSLAIASAVGGEGCTMMALALALRAAKGERRTLLVDMNLDHPEIHQRFGMQRFDWHPDDEASWTAAMQVDPTSGLTVLTSPTSTGDHWSFRDRTAMAICLSKWHADFECVIVDTSPLTRQNSRNIPAGTLCGAMGGTLMTVLAARTPAGKLIEAKKQLESHGAKLLGTIINDRHLPGLPSELIRETRRLDRFVPRMMDRIRTRIQSSALLNQQI